MPDKPPIQFDDFVKLDLRVATITQAEAHPRADKLIVLQVDLGTEQRQIIAGLRGFYEPEALVGKQIVILTNLPPRKMRGLESNGMLLAAVSEDQSSVILLTTDQEATPGWSVS
ncbi:MAG: methionine--tRNA ligase subunit beta [Phycisphaerae bacterium]